MKLKILNYHPFFLPSRGGTETNIYSFAEHSEHKHYVLTDMLPGTKERERVGACGVIRVRPSHRSMPPKGAAPLDAFLELPRELVKIFALRELDYDLLHLRFGSITPRLFVGLDNRMGISVFSKLVAWRTSGQPLVVTFHTLPSVDSEVLETASAQYVESWRQIEAFVCEHADAITCVDEFMVEPLREISEGKQISLIPSGVDTDLFKPFDRDHSLSQLPSRVREAIEETKFNVLSAVRVEPVKGSLLLRQLSEILPENANLIIAGRGEKSAVTGWRNTKFVGSLPNETIPHLMNCCDAAINFTVTPGVGRFTYEAIACGKPTIRLSSGRIYPFEDKKDVILVQNVEEAAGWIEKISTDESLREGLREQSMQSRQYAAVSTAARMTDDIYQSTIQSVH